jgi:hypothetical protein
MNNKEKTNYAMSEACIPIGERFQTEIVTNFGEKWYELLPKCIKLK